MSDIGTTLYCGDNCNHTGPHRYPPPASPEPTPGLRERIETLIAAYSEDAIWQDQVPYLVRTQVVDDLRAALAASPAPEPTPGLREAPFVVRQFEGQAWVPLREAVRLHEAHQDAVLTIAGLRNAAALAASPAPEPHVHSPSKCQACAAIAAPEPTGLDAAVLAKVLEYTGDGEGEGYHGARYRQYAENIIAAYESSARLNGVK